MISSALTLTSLPARSITLGSIALDMCFVADGALDGVIDTRCPVSSYDIMASALILNEAGGLLTDLKRRKNPVRRRESDWVVHNRDEK